MKYLLCFLLALCSCITNPDTGEREPDWPRIADGFELGASRLRDPALHDMARPLENGEQIIEALEKAALACDAASDAIEAFESDLTVLTAIKGAAIAASALSGLTDDEDTLALINFGVFAINSAVDFAAIMMPEELDEEQVMLEAAFPEAA